MPLLVGRSADIVSLKSHPTVSSPLQLLSLLHCIFWFSLELLNLPCGVCIESYYIKPYREVVFYSFINIRS